MKLLDQKQIRQKIKRLAIEILEHNYKEKEIILAGINNNGTAFAQLLFDELKGMTKSKIHLTRIVISPANPLEKEIVVEMPLKQMVNKAIIIVDDVANTGRTIFYAIKPLLTILPKKVEVAVLIDRKHKSFPIKVDYVGLSLATTMRENIDVKIREEEEQVVYLN